MRCTFDNQPLHLICDMCAATRETDKHPEHTQRHCHYHQQQHAFQLPTESSSMDLMDVHTRDIRLKRHASSQESIEKEKRDHKLARTSSEQVVSSGLKLVSLECSPSSYAGPSQNVESYSLNDLLGGSWKTMWQFNYLLDFSWFESKIPSRRVDRNMYFVVHGTKAVKEECEKIKSKRKYIKFYFPTYGENRGLHHTKMMIFFYENETARVVIHTANLIEQDWGKKTQGGWISSLLHKKDKKRPSGPNTTFESDLIRYLSAYADTSAVISDLKLYDFSHEKGVLVGSVPGSHECS